MKPNKNPIIVIKIISLIRNFTWAKIPKKQIKNKSHIYARYTRLSLNDINNFDF